MPPVSKRLRLWRSLPGTICKRASTIPADDLHTRMGKPPLVEGFGFSIGKEVDGNPPFEIDEDRSIAPPAAKRKIIHAQYPRRGHLALLLLANQPQERIRTGLSPHSINQPLAGFPSPSANPMSVKSSVRRVVRRAEGATTLGKRGVEDLPHTFLILAEKAPHMQFQPHRPTRAISKSATQRT